MIRFCTWTLDESCLNRVPTEERLADAGWEEELPTPMLSTLRAQISAAVDDPLPVEAKQRLDECSGRVSLAGSSAVVRNGHHKERTALMDVEPAALRIPRTRSQDGKSENFVSELIKLFQRHSPHMDELMAYTRPMGAPKSGSQMWWALMRGEETTECLSAPALNRLRRKKSTEYEERSRASLSDGQWVCM